MLGWVFIVGIPRMEWWSVKAWEDVREWLSWTLKLIEDVCFFRIVGKIWEANWWSICIVWYIRILDQIDFFW